MALVAGQMMTDQPQAQAGGRRMNWSCRKCGHRWSTPIPQTKVMDQAPVTDDGHQETICDGCLEAMTCRRT